jgi:hypothetical protein
MKGFTLKQVGLVCAAIALAAVALLAAVGRYFVPSSLTVYPPQGGCRALLDGEEIGRETSPARFSPLEYGPHEVRIVLSGGRVIWA